MALSCARRAREVASSATFLLAAIFASTVNAQGGSPPQGDLVSVLTQSRVTVGADGKEVLVPAAKAAPGDSQVTASVGSNVPLLTRNTFPGDTNVAIQDGAKSYSTNQLEQTITYSNVSAEALTNVVIRDATPAFTTYVSASCGSPPAGLTCTPPSSPTTAPAAGGTGGITWNFGGSLAPGASSAVTFQVQVNN